jgi:hypothetical protein
MHSNGRLVGSRGPLRLLLSIACELRRMLEAMRPRTCGWELRSPNCSHLVALRGHGYRNAKLGAGSSGVGLLARFCTSRPVGAPPKVSTSSRPQIDCVAASRSGDTMRQVAFAQCLTECKRTVVPRLTGVARSVDVTAHRCQYVSRRRPAGRAARFGAEAGPTRSARNSGYGKRHSQEPTVG